MSLRELRLSIGEAYDVAEEMISSIWPKGVRRFSGYAISRLLG